MITLWLPPLRERKEDIPQIAAFLLREHAGDQPLPILTPALKQALLAYEWPGNIRELENVMRKLLILGRPEIIIRDLHTIIKPVRAAATEAVRTAAPDNDTILRQVTKAKDEAETAAIRAALDSTHWNRRTAARLLKIDYKSLLYKMKKLGINDRMATLSPAAPATEE